MGHTYYNQFVHVVWATNYPTSYISDDTKDSLYAYIAGIVKEIGGGQFIARSGTKDHIHLLFNLPTDISLSDLLCKAKSGSSKWYRQQKGNSNFSWSEGFSAFTVSPEAITYVKEYFSKEDKRHSMCSLTDELSYFLNVHEIVSKPEFLTRTTYTRLIYHLVWSVKNREACLEKAFQNQLHEIIRNQVEEKNAKLYTIGSVRDHIHLLIECPGKLSTADLVGNLKTQTTSFVRSQNPMLRNFSWQDGYGVFSVGRPALEKVMAYVNDQENHHKAYTFEQEWKQIVGSNLNC